MKYITVPIRYKPVNQLIVYNSENRTMYIPIQTSNKELTTSPSIYSSLIYKIEV